MDVSCLRHDEVLIAKALIILGGWTITIVIWVIGRGLFTRVNLRVVLLLLFGCGSNRVFIVFGVAQSTVFSGASVAIF